ALGAGVAFVAQLLGERATPRLDRDCDISSGKHRLIARLILLTSAAAPASAATTAATALAVVALTVLPLPALGGRVVQRLGAGGGHPGVGGGLGTWGPRRVSCRERRGI